MFRKQYTKKRFDALVPGDVLSDGRIVRTYPRQRVVSTTFGLYTRKAYGLFELPNGESITVSAKTSQKFKVV